MRTARACSACFERTQQPWCRVDDERKRIDDPHRGGRYRRVTGTMAFRFARIHRAADVGFTLDVDAVGGDLW